MENYETAYKYICRVCLSYRDGEKFVSLIDNSCDNGLTCYGKAVLNFANISLKHNYNLPNVMCQNCLLLLKHAIYFKLKCESSEKRLLQLTKKTANKDLCEENLKEIIVQYAMYTQYFPSENTEESSSTYIGENIEEEFEVGPYLETNDYCSLSDGDKGTSRDSDDDLLDELEEMSDKFTILHKQYVKRPLKSKNLLRRNKMKINKLKKLQLVRRRLQERRRMDQKVPRTTEKLVCKICQKILANPHTYNHHMQRHNGCRYICEHCGKGFPVLLELQMHQVARHGTGPYLQCQHCTYKAPRKINLIEHERLHTGERPYTCDKCGLTFRRRAIWRKHMVYHTEKSVQCPQCPKKFFRRSEMLAHANNMHERIYMYLCHKCDATYAKPATVRRHLTERHGIPREMQGKIVRINKGRNTRFPEQ
ncbi:zinc finger protein 271-like [Galleria mellonella]|uniref:Zinc finger protein 271-like n=1 Tax=Galleria mellonella TaxID=7137 RepID=A0A6J1W7B9_GALME|nr:zinc finger protein 271-like [Galleria mellonella]